MDDTNLLENKKSVPYEFNNVARNYDLATFFSQGYQKDLFLSVERMQLSGKEYIADLCPAYGGASNKDCCNREHSYLLVRVIGVHCSDILKVDNHSKASENG